jgi:hypothetical protein
MFAGFIEATREEVKIMKEKISAPAGGKSQRLSNLVSFNLLITFQGYCIVCSVHCLLFMIALNLLLYLFNTLRHIGQINYLINLESRISVSLFVTLGHIGKINYLINLEFTYFSQLVKE